MSSSSSVSLDLIEGKPTRAGKLMPEPPAISGKQIKQSDYLLDKSMKMKDGITLRRMPITDIKPSSYEIKFENLEVDKNEKNQLTIKEEFIRFAKDLGVNYVSCALLGFASFFAAPLTWPLILVLTIFLPPILTACGVRYSDSENN
jgi:hypothetical protein